VTDENVEPEPLDPEEAEPAQGGKRAGERMRRIDSSPGALRVARAFRKLLPGDPEYGDRLSTSGEEPSQVLGQRVAALTAERPSALREVGLSALQVWQALSDAPGGSETYAEVAILFTDLVNFSKWALEAGDEAAVALLRQVGDVSEPPIEAAGGRVVKRLGDGLMAVFDEPQPAVDAAFASAAALALVEVGGFRPRQRAGVHFGRAQRVGNDYLGVEVNVAARVASAAGGGEVLVSEPARELLDASDLRLKRKWLFRAKGAPEDLRVYSVRRL
jgi:adenylate cyclase